MNRSDAAAARNDRILRRIITGRGLRAFADGLISILLPIYLRQLGYSPLGVGAIATATLLGSAMLTLVLGFAAHRLRLRRGLLAAALLMVATGLGFASLRAFWPLLLVAFVGTLNPSGGDVSVFLPLEHSLIAQSVPDRARTSAYARYSFVGSLGAAIGALAAGSFDWIQSVLPSGTAARSLFLLYAAVGLATLSLYCGLPEIEAVKPRTMSGLGPSRRRVYSLAALFAVDAFGGGFIVNTMLALWLFERFGLSASAAGTIFFATGVCASASFFAAERLAARFGLINTMVFTHLPSNVFLILAAFAPTLPLTISFLILRSLLSQMDVPTRSSYVMAVVEPEERPAAAGVTAVPRSLAAAVSPTLAGVTLSLSSFGWPLICAGVLKIAYDLALLRRFRAVLPPEERR